MGVSHRSLLEWCPSSEVEKKLARTRTGTASSPPSSAACRRRTGGSAGRHGPRSGRIGHRHSLLAWPCPCSCLWLCFAGAGLVDQPAPGWSGKASLNDAQTNFLRQRWRGVLGPTSTPLSAPPTTGCRPTTSRNTVAPRVAHRTSPTNMGLSLMDYDFLYDPARPPAGHRLQRRRAAPDAGCYDLLASEARLACFVAIAQGSCRRRAGSPSAACSPRPAASRCCCRGAARCSST
jgi:hypothetical protein